MTIGTHDTHDRVKQKPTTREAADTKHPAQSLLDQVELHGPGTLNFFVIFGQAQLQYDGRWPASIPGKTCQKKRLLLQEKPVKSRQDVCNYV